MLFRKCGLKKQPYEKRLKFLGIETLELRRMKLDIILAHKMFHGLTYDCDILQRSLCTRDHRNNLKLLKEKSGCVERLRFFSNRVVNTWNALPEYIIAGSEDNLKRYIGL